MQFDNLKKYVVEVLSKRLPNTLHYHGWHHTEYVFKAAEELCEFEKLNPYESQIVLTSVLLHDIGFINTYIDHEEEGCKIAREILPNFNYSESEINLICSHIMCTKIPQSANTHLEQIICDADLDYIGTDHFKSIGDLLYQEFLENNILKNEDEWNNLQIRFLNKHTFYTEFSRRNREPKKQENLKKLLDIINKL